MEVTEIINSIKIPDITRTTGEEVAKQVMKAMGNSDYKTSLFNYFNVVGAFNRIIKVKHNIPIDLQKAKILEIGSGFGMFLVVARKLGLDCRGIEPGRASYQRNKQAIDAFLHANNLPSDSIIDAKAEDCCQHFGKESFDLIVSFSVLEHVEDQRRAIKEMASLLKPGGYLYLTCSNHRSFYEGHYGVFWLPFLSKNLGRFYLRCIGKNVLFLEELNLIRPKVIKRYLKEEEFRIISFYPYQTHSNYTDFLVNLEKKFTREAKIVSIIKSLVRKIRAIDIMKHMGLESMLCIVAQKEVV